MLTNAIVSWSAWADGSLGDVAIVSIGTPAGAAADDRVRLVAQVSSDSGGVGSEGVDREAVSCVNRDAETIGLGGDSATRNLTENGAGDTAGGGD